MNGQLPLILCKVVELKFNKPMNKRITLIHLTRFSTLLLLGTIGLSACGSGAATNENQGFDYSTRLSKLTENAEKCRQTYMTPEHNIDTWQSPRWSEVEKYSWVEYSDYSDYYKYRLEDPSFHDFDVADVTDSNVCIEFLNKEIESLKAESDPSAIKLTDLYTKLRDNRTSFLIPAQQMSDLPVTSANRAKYLQLEDSKRALATEAENIFYQIRQVIDFTYIGNVKVFIEKCAMAFSVLGKDTVYDGSILLTNDSDSIQDVSFTIRFKNNDDILVGHDYVSESVPANSKVRASISAVGSSDGVGGGWNFPARCTLERG